MSGFLILDVEANALFDYTKPANSPGQPRACAIALIFVNPEMEIEEERHALIKPEGWALDPDCEAAKVNGLTMERLLDEGVPVKEMLSAYDSGLQVRRVVVGHNVAGFDLKIMRAEMRRAGMEDRYMQTRSICTMYGTRKICNVLDVRGKVKNPKLHEACKHFGIDPGESHTALDDARSCLSILRAVRDLGLQLPISDPYNKPKKAKVA